MKTATKALAGTNSGLVPDLISLQVTTPDAPDLTLIDLPGIVRNHIGDQPKDIEKQIKDLIHKHITGLFTPAAHECSISAVLMMVKAGVSSPVGVMFHNITHRA